MYCSTVKRPDLLVRKGRYRKAFYYYYYWSVTWQLRFHPEKCHVLRVGTCSINYIYTMPTYTGAEDVILQVNNSEKDLGVIIDNHLNYREHTAKIILRANQTLGIIRRTLCYLDMYTLVTLYKARIRPIIEYGLPAWSPLYRK